MGEPPALGYLLGEPGELTYFPGDTEIFDGMAELAGARHRPGAAADLGLGADARARPHGP